MTDLEIINSIFMEQKQQEEELSFRNPSVPFWYNWCVFFLLVALAVSIVIAGVYRWADNRAAEITREAYAAWQAEQAMQIEAEGDGTNEVP